jgi:hypothetical protein
MKSRRELLSALLIDVARAILIAFVIGKVTNPSLITWHIVLLSLTGSTLLVIIAYLIHPEAEADKTWMKGWIKGWIK